MGPAVRSGRRSRSPAASGRTESSLSPGLVSSRKEQLFITLIGTGRRHLGRQPAALAAVPRAMASGSGPISGFPRRRWSLPTSGQVSAPNLSTCGCRGRSGSQEGFVSRAPQKVTTVTSDGPVPWERTSGALGTRRSRSHCVLSSKPLSLQSHQRGYTHGGPRAWCALRWEPKPQ